MIKRGYALPEDAMYWGLRILEEIPYLQEALVARFPEIIIDEAQDTSETQVKIIETLAEAGCGFALVGDPDQSIFEFNGARPDLFQGFEQKWNSILLSRNFRSSQNICNATHRFSTLLEAAKAAGAYKHVAIKPLIFIYPPDNENLVIAHFKKQLKDNNIECQDSAVLARRHDMLAKISGRALRWPKKVGNLSKTFAMAATYRDQHGENSLVAKAHERVMYGLLVICFETGSYGANFETIAQIGLREWRGKSWMLLHRLPSSDNPLRDWGQRVRQEVETFLQDVGWPRSLDLSRRLTRCNDTSADHPVANFVNVPVIKEDLTYEVIHQAKGKTYDAVLVICGRSRGKPSDLDQWLNPVNGGENEERRVGYVAMTRPRRLLALAVPQESRLDGLDECFEIEEISR